MNKFSLLLLLFACNTHAQEADIKFYKYNLSKLIVLPEGVYAEAEKLNVQEDKVLVSFVINPDCTAAEFKVTRAGKLKTLADFIAKKSKEITDDFIKKYPCENIKKVTSFSFPIVISFYSAE